MNNIIITVFFVSIVAIIVGVSWLIISFFNRLPKKKPIYTTVVAFALLCVTVLTSHLINAKNYEVLDVANDCFVTTPDKIKERFNWHIETDYEKAGAFNKIEGERDIYYVANITDYAQIAIFQDRLNPIGVKGITLNIRTDEIGNAEAERTYGYYITKLIYAIAPDISDGEITKIISDLRLNNLISNEPRISERNGVQYSFFLGDKEHSFMISTISR